MYLSSLLVLCTVAMSLAHNVNPCAPCFRKNTTLPLHSYIPGDNYCKANQNNEEILLELYHTLGGANWDNNQNWLSGDYCNWYGIDCNQNRDVVTIDLHGNNLLGNQLPPSIGCFTYLKSLVLDNNNISGQIPQNFCNLKNIQYLTIPGNNLGGFIPSCFSNLYFLEHLYLFNNGLIGELPDFSNFTSIKEIHVEHNCLTGKVPQNIPSQVVIDLSFADNDFTGCIPDFYSNIIVDFSGNTNFCNQEYIPCFLSPSQLGCPANPRHNVESIFSYCPGSSCLSFKFSSLF